MRKWGIERAILILVVMLTGCCGTVARDVLLVSCKDFGRHQGDFVGHSSDPNGNRCEIYELRDKSYQTICAVVAFHRLIHQLSPIHNTDFTY